MFNIKLNGRVVKGTHSKEAAELWIKIEGNPRCTYTISKVR